MTPTLSLPTQSLFVAYVLTLLGAITMVGGVTLIRALGYTTPLQGRKLMHIATGPVFILCWLLFPPSPWSPYLASTVPLFVSLYMLGTSRGYFSNRPLIETVSRSGRAVELSQGPFLYGLVHAAATVAYWTHSPTGIVALLILCIGDGVADLVGRPFGFTKWPHNRNKSVEGSVAFVVASIAGMWPICILLFKFGLFNIEWWLFQRQLIFCVLGAAAIESLPLGNYDNVAIFVGVAAIGAAFGW